MSRFMQWAACAALVTHHCAATTPHSRKPRAIATAFVRHSIATSTRSSHTIRARRRSSSDSARPKSNQRCARQRCLEERDRARQSPAPVLRPRERSGGLLRHGHGRWRDRGRDGARTRREPRAHRSRVVHRARERSRAARPAPARRAAGQPAQSRVPRAASAAAARRAAQRARRPRGAEPHRRQLLRRDHVARPLRRARARGLRSRRERLAGAGRRVLAAAPPRVRRPRRRHRPRARKVRSREPAAATAWRASRTSTSRW